MYVYNLWSIIIYNHRIWIFAQAITLVIVCLRSPVCKFPSGCQTSWWVQDSQPAVVEK